MGIVSSEATTILSVIIPESVAENVSRAACIASTGETKAVAEEEVGRLQKLTSDAHCHNPHPGM